MTQSLGLVSLLVRDYDEALGFYVGKLGFELMEDTYIAEQDKRWVVVKPPGAGELGSCLLLAQRSRNPASAIRREGEYSCSSTLRN